MSHYYPVTYMFILKCALKLVEEIILYYDARSKKHKKEAYIWSVSDWFCYHSNDGNCEIATAVGFTPMMSVFFQENYI